MKRLVYILAGLIIVGSFLILLIFRLLNRVPSEEYAENLRVQMILDKGGCLVCHNMEPEFPFYSNFPVIGKMVREDAAEALVQIDLNEAMTALKANQPVGEVALAKIEKSILDRTMPLFNYYMIHWASFITEAEREIILNWARNHRLAHYSNGLAADEFLNEAVQPVEDYIPVDQAKVALGDLLYHDTRLSLDNTLSCASCHDLETAGVDNEIFSPGVGGQIGTINSPTVFNSVYNFVQFWDGRAPTLATQAAQPPLNPVEMASISFEQIIDKLKQDKELSRQFHKVYPEGYSEATITDAIAEFEKTLLTPNSRLDRYLKGEASAMSELELKGYALFKDYECATCHVGVYMGGQSYEKMGMARDYFADRGTELSLDDMGRFKETGIERDRHRFKVPGLRNVALTEPYFHDGTRKNLRDATADMALYQLDISLEEEELDAFEAFYETLTGEYQGKLLMNKNLNR